MGRVGELLVILAIVFLLFGTRRLKDFGSDLGAAIKGFKSQIGDGRSGEEPFDDRQHVQQISASERPSSPQSQNHRV